MRIFISHSHEDKLLADALIDFLSNGIGIPGDNIFCTSSSGKGVPLGLNFNDYIIQRLQEEDVQVLALITNNYFNSKYSMYELGASWGLCRNTIPILGPRMQYANMDGFLAANIGIRISNDEDVNKLTDDLHKKWTGKRASVSDWQKAKQELFKRIKSFEPNKTSMQQAVSQNTDSKKNYKYKVVAFDFDGALLQSNNPGIGNAFHFSWRSVWSHLGYDDKIRRTLYDRHRYDPKSYTYQDWCDECAHYFKQKKFKKDHIREIIQKEKLRIAEGLYTTLNSLRKCGIVTAIISGGIDTFYQETFPDELKKLFTKVYFNKFEYDTEGYLQNVLAYQNSESDFGGKVQALKEVCRIAGCTTEEAVFVGEGTNDIDVAKSAGLSIAYPPSATQDFRDIADIVTEDFNIASILCEVLVPKPSFIKKEKSNDYRKNV